MGLSIPKSVVRMTGAAVTIAMLAACGTSYLAKPAFMRGSYEDWKASAQIHGKKMLEDALSESETISVRSHSGGLVSVFMNIELNENQFCGDFLAIWSPTPRESWIEYDRDGSASTECYDYSTAASVRAGDVRHCEGGDCLWIRGFIG
ncbi:MAG: hypothetical protein Hens3KO_25740 [Henriciella sp.]